MQTTEPDTVYPPPESTDVGDGYFGNPYRTLHEQYGFEFIDRRSDNSSEIERVVILGYN